MLLRRDRIFLRAFPRRKSKPRDILEAFVFHE
jgi:hypothetical protein